MCLFGLTHTRARARENDPNVRARSRRARENNGSLVTAARTRKNEYRRRCNAFSEGLLLLSENEQLGELLGEVDADESDAAPARLVTGEARRCAYSLPNAHAAFEMGAVAISSQRQSWRRRHLMALAGHGMHRRRSRIGVRSRRAVSVWRQRASQFDAVLLQPRRVGIGTAGTTPSRAPSRCRLPSRSGCRRSRFPSSPRPVRPARPSRARARGPRRHRSRALVSNCRRSRSTPYVRLAGLHAPCGCSCRRMHDARPPDIWRSRRDPHAQG